MTIIPTWFFALLIVLIIVPTIAAVVLWRLGAKDSADAERWRHHDLGVCAEREAHERFVKTQRAIALTKMRITQ